MLSLKIEHFACLNSADLLVRQDTTVNTALSRYKLPLTVDSNRPSLQNSSLRIESECSMQHSEFFLLLSKHLHFLGFLHFLRIPPSSAYWLSSWSTSFMAAITWSQIFKSSCWRVCCFRHENATQYCCRVTLWYRNFPIWFKSCFLRGCYLLVISYLILKFDHLFFITKIN